MKNAGKQKHENLEEKKRIEETIKPINNQKVSTAQK